MATGNLGPFVDMRSVITLARQGGERLAGRITRDVQALVFGSPGDLPADVRKLERGVRTRADAAVKGLEAGGALVVGAVDQLSKASSAVLRRFSAATQDEVDALARRLATLEKRLGALERRQRKSRRSSA